MLVTAQIVATAIDSSLLAVLVIVAKCCTCADPEQPSAPSPEQRQRAALAALAAATLGAICLEALRPGELYSEVPACGHVFHFLGNCVATWARSKGSCPLCTAKIVPGSDVAVADDMVLCRWCVAADKTVFRMGEE
ncbi:hypothetical protein EJB05_50051, partial [Eragrostis curvula]